jgi:uncharacterized protein YndB with AHSA1/START domain
MIKKTDSPATRSVEVVIDVPGTPEEVWRAIATGPGFTAWFMPTRLEEREGGAVAFEMAPGMETNGVVKVWEPPRRFVAEEREWMPGGPPIATEIHVEARPGGTCTVRLVTSLFTSSADWDDQLESVEKGWPTFLHILRLYLTHFAGQPCARALLIGHAAGSVGEGWAALSAALGVSGAREGQRVEAAAPGFPAIAGVVERAGEHEVTIRTEQPAPGFAWIAVEDCGAGAQPMVNLYMYGDPGPATLARNEPAWREWMEQRFPAPATTGAGATTA